MSNLLQALVEVLRSLLQVLKSASRVFVWIARDAMIFPTAVADALSPLFRLSVSVDAGPRPNRDFERRIEKITQQLKQSGSDAQTLLNELDSVMAARRQQLLDVQARLVQVEAEESQVAARVESLRNVKPEAAVAINALLDESLEERDKRGARRDWLIFGMGVLTTAALSLVFFLLA